MEEKVLNFLRFKESLTKELKDYVQDTSIDLDIRWKLFIDSKLGDHRTYYAEFANISSDTYYDNYNLDKYKTINVQTLLEGQNTLIPEEIIEFKEDVLKQFIYSFEYDW